MNYLKKIVAWLKSWLPCSKQCCEQPQSTRVTLTPADYIDESGNLHLNNELPKTDGEQQSNG